MIYFPERMLKPPPGIGFPNYTYYNKKWGKIDPGRNQENC